MFRVGSTQGDDAQTLPALISAVQMEPVPSEPGAATRD